MSDALPTGDLVDRLLDRADQEQSLYTLRLLCAAAAEIQRLRKEIEERDQRDQDLAYEMRIRDSCTGD